jgi:hypothetical protein
MPPSVQSRAPLWSIFNHHLGLVAQSVKGPLLLRKNAIGRTLLQSNTFLSGAFTVSHMQGLSSCSHWSRLRLVIGTVIHE